MLRTDSCLKGGASEEYIMSNRAEFVSDLRPSRFFSGKELFPLRTASVGLY